MWTEKLSTGVPRIDEEHREIFRQLNEIRDALQQGQDAAVVNHLAEVLLDYAYLHFHHEEHAMACAHCTRQEHNCQAHRQFIERLRTWLCLMNSGQLTRATILSLHTETSLWIQHHIQEIDVGLAPPQPGTDTHRLSA